MSKTKKPKWRKGPPPSIGWWPASPFKDKEILRWWDGEIWSAATHVSSSAEYAGAMSQVKSMWSANEVYWADRPASWPEWSKT